MNTTIGCCSKCAGVSQLFELKIPSRLYWPFRFHSDGQASLLHWETPNPEIDQWIKDACKGSFSVIERERTLSEDEFKKIKSRLPIIRETFAIFENEEDAALFKLFWL